MGQRIAGTCYVAIDGTTIKITGTVEAPLMAVKRESVMALDSNAGYKETAVEQYLKVEAAFTRDFPIAQLRNATNATVVAQFANNKVYTLTGAYLRDEAAVDGVEGKITLDFGGVSGIWR